MKLQWESKQCTEEIQKMLHIFNHYEKNYDGTWKSFNSTFQKSNTAYSKKSNFCDWHYKYKRASLLKSEKKPRGTKIPICKSIKHM